MKIIRKKSRKVGNTPLYRPIYAAHQYPIEQWQISAIYEIDSLAYHLIVHHPKAKIPSIVAMTEK